jgi:nucleotide-binding universal stress UspA family protein
MAGIIVGIDGSDHSRRALEWAVKEAAIRHAPLTVLVVQPAIAGYTGSAVAYPGDAALADQARKTAQEETDQVLAGVGGSGPESVTVQAAIGIPAAVLIAASQGADLVVVGSRGSGGFRELVLGSVSTQVTHHAHCPVVVIPAEDRG